MSKEGVDDPSETEQSTGLRQETRERIDSFAGDVQQAASASASKGREKLTEAASGISGGVESVADGIAEAMESSEIVSLRDREEFEWGYRLKGHFDLSTHVDKVLDRLDLDRGQHEVRVDLSMDTMDGEDTLVVDVIKVTEEEEEDTKAEDSTKEESTEEKDKERERS